MTLAAKNETWPLWKKILFRFFFIYLILQAAPWMWLNGIPGVYTVTKWYDQLMDWAVHVANANIFHVRKVLVPVAGSGDTSWGWAQQWLFLCVAALGCIIWSLVERKKNNYVKLNYWLCLIIRYYLVTIAFLYGFAKIFLQQMSFPSQSQLATPLGDFLPMRFSWLFMGYSDAYQAFAGCLEVLAGTLLLFRKTATLGVLLALAVFSNVMVMNMSFDIPVKIFSINIVVFCLFLLANELNRILCFFVLNKPAAVCSIYHFRYPKKWMRITRYVLKIAFVLIIIVWQFYQYLQIGKSETVIVKRPIKPGIYNVAVFKVNKDSLPISSEDSLRWQDVIFENNGEAGSIKTADTSFRQRYKRGYFSFETDSIKHLINFKKLETDSAMYNGIILSMHYNFPDSNTIELWGKKNDDSLYVLLKRSNRHFQLAEKQFHWLSEYNR